VDQAFHHQFISRSAAAYPAVGGRENPILSLRLKRTTHGRKKKAAMTRERKRKAAAQYGEASRRRPRRPHGAGGVMREG
jgi:hypothetical protein